MSNSTVHDFYRQLPEVPASESTRLLLNAVHALIEPNGGGIFLDIGCHNGVKTMAMSRWIGAAETLGLDYAGPALCRAKALGVQAVAVDLNQHTPLPFPPESMDCIHTGEVIEHLFSPDHLLMEITRLLKPDGYAVLSTPNLASWRNRLVLPLGWQPFGSEVSTTYRVGNPRAPHGPLAGHIRLFTPAALMELVRHYGLSIERFTGWSSGQPVDLLTRAFAVVDAVVARWFPALCDGILLKLRKEPRRKG